MKPSPQAGKAHSFVQPSVLISLPSSHSSPNPVCKTSSPQNSSCAGRMCSRLRQLAAVIAGSSPARSAEHHHRRIHPGRSRCSRHCVNCVAVIAFLAQARLQHSITAGFILAGRVATVTSCCATVIAGFACVFYSITAGWKAAVVRQASATVSEFNTPSSQASPNPVCSTPSPQVSSWQVALQPSPATVPPSSHSSPKPVCSTPSPQVSSWQVALQPSPATVPPSSHSSPSPSAALHHRRFHPGRSRCNRHQLLCHRHRRLRLRLLRHHRRLEGCSLFGRHPLPCRSSILHHRRLHWPARTPSPQLFNRAGRLIQPSVCHPGCRHRRLHLQILHAITADRQWQVVVQASATVSPRFTVIAFFPARLQHSITAGFILAGRDATVTSCCATVIAGFACVFYSITAGWKAAVVRQASATVSS